MMPLFVPIKLFFYFLYFLIAGTFFLDERPTVFAAACIAIVAGVTDFIVEVFLQKWKTNLWMQASVHSSLMDQRQMGPRFIVAAIIQMLVMLTFALLIIFSVDENHLYGFSQYIAYLDWIGTIGTFCVPGLIWIAVQYWAAVYSAVQIAKR